jgi:hypothetical protein
LLIFLEGQTASEEDLISLAEELSLLRSVRVETAPSGPVPEGSKGLTDSILGILCTGVGNGLPTLFGTLGSWLTRQPAQTKIRLKDGDFEFEWNGDTPPEYVTAALKRALARRKG